jgi:8-oxo-dGTP diphosphatase
LEFAAVSVLVCMCKVLMIKRAERKNDPWSGQVAFPGGRVKQGESELECALRELFEEVGISLSKKPDLKLEYFEPSNEPELKVRPFVFFLERCEQNITLSDEVFEARWIPISELKRSSASINGVLREVYVVKDWVIWGMSKRILDTLLSGVLSPCLKHDGGSTKK